MRLFHYEAEQSSYVNHYFKVVSPPNSNVIGILLVLYFIYISTELNSNILNVFYSYLFYFQ